MHRINLIFALTLVGACYSDYVVADDGYATAVDTNGDGSPDLAYVAPGVSVVSNYDYPVFYANNAYWLYNNGGWYTSPYYYGGWAWATPPAVVLGIASPWSYAHYHPYGYYARGYGYGHGYYNRGYYNHGYYNRGYTGGNYYRGGTYHGGGYYHGGGVAHGYGGGGYHGGGGGYYGGGGGYHGGGGGYHGGGGGYHGGGGGYHGGGGGHGGHR